MTTNNAEEKRGAAQATVSACLASKQKTTPSEIKTNAEHEVSTIEFLWKTIQRYDYYIGSTNTKATTIVAFNTFVFGTIILKWPDLLPMFAAHPKAVVLAGSLLSVAAVAAVLSTWSAFRVINPFLRSPKKPFKYHSLVYFDHVAEHEIPEDYLARIKLLDLETLQSDLGHQAHVLAQGTAAKFAMLKFSIGVILTMQLPALALLVLVKLLTLVSDISTKMGSP
jgi:Family of unknown function (DUF5706)